MFTGDPFLLSYLGIELVHSAIQITADDHLGSITGPVHGFFQVGALILGEFAQDMGNHVTMGGKLSHTHADAKEILAAAVGNDRL